MKIKEEYKYYYNRLDKKAQIQIQLLIFRLIFAKTNTNTKTAFICRRTFQMVINSTVNQSVRLRIVHPNMHALRKESYNFVY